MKIRSERRHHMGTSNSGNNNFQTTNNFKTQSVFERSFNKSKSIFDESNSQLYQNNNKSSLQGYTHITDPFLGSHNQFETKRFDKSNIRPFKYSHSVMQTKYKPVTYSDHLNKQVNSIKQQFNKKNINLHKIKQLKQAFIKNNRNVRNLKQYFKKYCNTDNHIDLIGFKKLVKQYGFDINEDQSNLIFRLSQKANNSQQFNNYLQIDQFVQLMTRDNIYYKTMKLNSDDNKVNHNAGVKKNFSDKIHEILRNKYPRIKEAFKIYRQRNQNIGKKQYQYVMKKLDLTNLVITQQERQKIFNDYSDQKGQFNVEKLICAIAQQQYANRQLINRDTYKRFSEEIDANKQISFQKQKQIRNFSLKNLSSLEYQTQFIKARKVIQQLQKLRQKQKDENKDGDLFKNLIKNGFANKQEIIKNAEKILKKQGISFHKDQYDAFGAYLNCDVNNNISHKNINQELFFETQNQARQRFQRKVRNQHPKNQHMENSSNLIINQKLALQCLDKIRQYKLNPETRQLFTYFDNDKDGYISTKQFEHKLKQTNALSQSQIQNLAIYMKIKQKGYINFQEFIKKIKQNPQKHNQLPNLQIRNSKSCYDWSQMAKSKKEFIKNTNQTFYQRPTKFSAWPSHVINPDLTMIQPPSKAGMYISEFQRFNERKQDYAMKQKQIKMNITQGRIQKISQWNRIIQDRVKKNEEKQERRNAGKNYSLRLTRQEYQLRCHQ